MASRELQMELELIIPTTNNLKCMQAGKELPREGGRVILYPIDLILDVTYLLPIETKFSDLNKYFLYV